MKQLFLFLTLAYTLLATDAKDAAFMLDFEDNYSVALEKAKEEDKLLMLVIIQDPCPYCEMLAEETLSDPEVREVLNTFVSVIIDKHGQYPEAFRTSATPRCFFINPRSERGIWESLGYVKVKPFLKVLKEARDRWDATE